MRGMPQTQNQVRRNAALSQKVATNATPGGDYEAIVKLLFPNTSVQTLKSLSRANLLEQARLEGDFTPGTSNYSSSVTSPDVAIAHKPRSVPDSDANDRLYKLQYQDSAIFEWDENSPGVCTSVEDDVNALSLSKDPKSSFVGISSVAAAVRALTKILPSRIENPPGSERAKSEIFEDLRTTTITTSNLGPICSYREEQRLIDAYFAKIHVFAPVIHEPSFRSRYLNHQGTTDRSWLALLNIVLALGSITSSAGDSEEDLQYFHLAQQYLSLESFGSGRLETLQALLLMGGQYLHFRNRPNMASAIIGACYRIASGLGLHLQSPDDMQGKVCPQEELKRRNWWTIYVLDTWGSVTLGRPSTTHGIAVDLPNNLLDDKRGILPMSEPTINSPLIHNIELCKIMNQIQDRLIVNSVMADDELRHYDEMLLSWFENLPPFLHSANICPPDLQDARVVLKWRYHNIRFLLHRPILLDTVIRSIPMDHLALNERIAVSKCREVAMETIFSIQAEWRPNKICCWNAVWFLFQACLIPLMAIAVESEDHADYQNWCNQVQTGIDACEEMSQFSPVGQKTKTFLTQLFMAVVNNPTVNSKYDMITEAQPPIDTVMGLFAGDWDQLNGYNVFGHINTVGNPYLDDHFLEQYYAPSGI
ncbi:hypothetical protein N7481_000999 [Penicillium waksmanii]|uniref:uncharacterized protein n=1 Tax=Penicillium waksmanii TaxID=69791 RepID=UPI002546CEDC|nr:uncharacterized protein N7481_000999 [Penicillium waksmanii]KAJ6000590.1 hypothetical protein N7481_000999 [Penicillium waksmanii]